MRPPKLHAGETEDGSSSKEVSTRDDASEELEEYPTVLEENIPPQHDRIPGIPPSDSGLLPVASTSIRRRLSKISEHSDNDSRAVERLVDITNTADQTAEFEDAVLGLDDIDIDVDSGSYEFDAFIDDQEARADATISPTQSKRSARSSGIPQEAITGWNGDVPVVNLNNPSIAPTRESPAVAVRTIYQLRSGATRMSVGLPQRESSTFPITPTPMNRRNFMDTPTLRRSERLQGVRP